MGNTLASLFDFVPTCSNVDSHPHLLCGLREDIVSRCFTSVAAKLLAEKCGVFVPVHLAAYPSCRGAPWCTFLSLGAAISRRFLNGRVCYSMLLKSLARKPAARCEKKIGSCPANPGEANKGSGSQETASRKGSSQLDFPTHTASPY